MKFGVPELEDLGDVEGRSVLVRADFNVPLKDGQITDDLRIRAALPTLQWLTERGARVTACTHLGRPKGAPDPKYSVEPVRERLAELAPERRVCLGRELTKLHEQIVDCTAGELASRLAEGSDDPIPQKGEFAILVSGRAGKQGGEVEER